MNNKTWGGRFKKATHPDVVKFNASLQFDHVLYKQDIAGSKAHAAMLAQQSLVNHDEADLMIQGLNDIEMEFEQGMHALDTDCEDIHMFIEKLLIQKIGETAKKLHTGRSRNDQVALDLRLYIREAADGIDSLLQQLVRTLTGLSEQYKHNRMPGYTHLQQAQPIFLGAYFSAYASMFARDISRLHDWHQRMNYSPLGAGALAGSSLPLNRQAVAKALSFNGIVENTLDAVSDRDFVIEFGSIASIIMMHLSRLAEDLILFATQEFNFIILDDAFATGSSLMPNKKNPDVLELIRGKSGRVFGNLMGILTVMKGLPLAYNKDMQEDKESLFDTVNTLTSCLSIISPFLQSLQFNVETMEEKASGGYLDATSVLESLVLQGVPFRNAHHQVGEWVTKAIEKNYSLVEIQEMKSWNAIPHLATGMELSSDDINAILELASNIKQAPEKYSRKLANKKLVMLFEKPSFRTRLSFSLAIQTLGGMAVESIGNSRKQEYPADMMRVLNGYCDFVMLRTHDDAAFSEMTAHATIPVINGLSALYHPCQILADLLSLKERFGKLEGLTLAYIGDGNNILHSLLLMAPLMGVKIHYCCPENKQPEQAILTNSQINNQMVNAFPTPQTAVKNAHAIYTDVWTSMGFESNSEEDFAGFQVNESLMSDAESNAVFMHCMPMERGKEVSTSLPDSQASIIFEQSENRLHVQKALLVYLHERMP